MRFHSSVPQKTALPMHPADPVPSPAFPDQPELRNRRADSMVVRGRIGPINPWGQGEKSIKNLLRSLGDRYRRNKVHIV